MAIYLPETTQTSTESLTPREIVAELDKYVVGQAGGEARRGDRPAQPHAPAEAGARDGRGDRAEEHPDDRPDRRRQDGDRAPAGAPRAVAVREGRGQQVHRGRLRRPRRRVDGPRSGRARRSTWCAPSGSRKSGRRRCRTPRIGCSTLLLPPTRAAAPDEDAAAASRPADADARAVPRTTARRASSTAASSRSTSARKRSRRSRSSPDRRSRKWTSTSRTCCRGSSRARRRSAS